MNSRYEKESTNLLIHNKAQCTPICPKTGGISFKPDKDE